MDIHTLKEQFWQIKRQILDFYDEYVITYTRNLACGLFSSMHISLLAEPDILFICKVEEVTEQLMETTTRQFENLKKENDHQLWLKEQYATSCASPKTAIKQIFPAMNECQKTAPVINISASSSDSLSACSFPENIPVQLTESLRDLTPLDSKDGSESSEGSVSAPLSEQINPKEEESHDTDSNSCTLRNQDMTFLEINGKLCNSVEESKSSDDSGYCLAMNKSADSAVQMAHTSEFSDCGDTPALSNNIIEFSDNEETVPVSSELMDFSDREEIPAVTKIVMDFSESLKISSVTKQTVEISDKEESQESETEQPVIRNESLLLEQDTVAASTTDSDLLFAATALPVSNSTVSEEQISDLPVSDFDVKSDTPMPPAVSLKLMTPENQQSETEAQVLKDIICPTKTKDLNLNLVFEDLMISTVLSVLLQETIINSKARAENVGNSVKVISEETPVLFLSKEQPFNVNRVEDQLPVVQTPCKETISDTTNTPEGTCNEEISVLSEDHPKELACGTSTFSDVNPVSKDLKTLVAPEFDTPKSSKTKENSDFFMFTLRTPVTHVSQVSMLCKPQTTINVNTAAETDKSCLSEGVTDLTVTNTPISSSKEESIEQETNVIKITARTCCRFLSGRSLNDSKESRALEIQLLRVKLPVTLSRVPEHPATDNGGLQTSRYPGVTAGAGQENTPLGNLDSQIPVVQNPVERPRRREDDARAEKKTEEDDAGRGQKPEQEDAETGERRSDGPHEEWSRLEHLTPGENLDRGQGSPEMKRLHHVPGGAWLQQLPDDTIPLRDLRRESRRPEKEKRKEKNILRGRLMD
ncbi:hypothetical protein NDU88_006739 [Pleurodeles waltl]|uniref:Uncharacterized protein n=1 Tax=Pleurodeles waltl TaxID=8319 RepID=A0AAV7MGM0_PLEWA|nr:hypothetical protein NDU88_006739 [Pleurodeles waltl]